MQLTPKTAGGAAPFDAFLAGLPEAVRANAHAIDELIPGGDSSARADALADQARTAFREAADYFADEVKMYDAAIGDVEQRWKQAERIGNLF